MIAVPSDPSATRPEVATDPGSHHAPSSGRNGEGVPPGRDRAADEAVAHFEELAGRLNEEAQRLFGQGQYAAAEHSVRQLLGLLERAVGTEHPDFAMGLSMLGELRFLQEDLPGAESLFRRSLQIREATLGRWHPDYAVSLACLGGVLWRLGRMDEAEHWFRQAMVIRFQVLGERHPESIQSRKELARLLRRRGDWAGAQALARSAVSHTAASAAAGARRDLTRDVVDLSSRFRNLGANLPAVARLMVEAGTPPPPGCVEHLAAARHGFLSVRDEALRRIDALRVPAPALEMIVTLQDLATLLDDLAELEVRQGELEVMRHRSLTILDRVLALSYQKDEPFPPLLECQDRVRQLRSTIADGHWMQLPAQTENLAEGTHALVKLLILVEQLDTLSDRSWAELHEQVGETLGKPLASAASRGRLVLRTAPAQVVARQSFASASSRADSARESRRAGRPVGTPGSERAVSKPEEPTVQDPADRSPDLGRTRGAAAVAGRAVIGDPTSALIRDLAVASLVPTMGRVINLPSDSPAEGTPHRLLRVGHAPTVVERPADGSAAAAVATATPTTSELPSRAGPTRAPLPPDLAGRLNAGRAALDRVISGPLPLLQSFGQVAEAADRDALADPPSWPASFNRGDLARLASKAAALSVGRSEALG